MALNQWIGIGRLTHDPDLSVSGSGVPYCNFSIAVNRPYRKDTETKTDFLRVTAWRGTAEFITKHFVKGDPIQIVGRVEASEYQDNECNKKQNVYINVTGVDFVEGYKRSEARASEPQPVLDEFTPIEEFMDDDCPF